MAEAIGITASMLKQLFPYVPDGRVLQVAERVSMETPALREQLFKKFRSLEMSVCPFANLPEPKSGRWGQGLTKAKMAVMDWLALTRFSAANALSGSSSCA